MLHNDRNMWHGGIPACTYLSVMPALSFLYLSENVLYNIKYSFFVRK